MRSSTNHASSSSSTVSQYKSIVPASPRSSHTHHHTTSPLHSFSLSTPDPSPTMNPEDPKIAMGGPSSSSSPSLGPEHQYQKHHQHHHHKTTSVTLPSIHQTHPELPSPSISANSSRALHSLYPAATPPMSPAHVLSPASRPHGFSLGSAATGESTSQHGPGFYQLPPPLQSFRPYEHHQHPLQASPPLQPVNNNYPPSHHSSPAFGAQPSPRLHPQSSSSSGPTSSIPTLPPSNTASPALGPISPYPTPQHQPIASPHPPSSPHQSPHYDRILPRQPTPSHFVLPSAATAASAPAASSTLVFPVQPPRAYACAPHPPTSTSTAAATSDSTSAPSSRKRSSASSTSTPLKSPRNSMGAKSASSSPIYMMLPPRSAPPLAGSTKRTSVSGSSSSSSLTTAAPSSSSSSSSSSSGKRRSATLSNKSVDQEAREMMRKVSHSAIERRRRERINDKILQLKHLVPACIDEDHLHKLSILQSTIEYIQYLKSCVPEHVANAKFKRASNNDPNNKTTDMLDALNAAVVATGAPIRTKVSPFSLHKPLAFAPMITTGLNQPFKKAKSERADRTPPGPLQFHGSHFNTAVAQNKESIRRASSASTSSSASTGAAATTLPPSQQMLRGDGRSGAAVMEDAPLSTSSSSSDEDAKDGLLMLSQLSAGGPYSSPPESKMATAKSAHGNLKKQGQKGGVVKRSAKNKRCAGSKTCQLSEVENEEEEEMGKGANAAEVQDIVMEDEQDTEDDDGDDDYLDEQERGEDEDEEEGEEEYDDDEDDDYIDESETPKRIAASSKRVRRTSEHDHDKPRRSTSKMSVDQMLC